MAMVLMSWLLVRHFVASLFRARCELRHPEALVTRRHTDKIAEPLPESFGAEAGGIDPSDAHPLVRNGKF